MGIRPGGIPLVNFVDLTGGDFITKTTVEFDSGEKLAIAAEVERVSQELLRAEVSVKGGAPSIKSTDIVKILDYEEKWQQIAPNAPSIEVTREILVNETSRMPREST